MEPQYNISEIKLTYKPEFKPSERPKITKSSELYAILKARWDDDLLELLEQFKVILLNSSNRVLGIIDVAMGCFDHVMVDTKVIFAAALTARASGMILAHNHPSGNPKPSNMDINLTNQIIEVAKMLGFNVLDHIIVTIDGYYSFLDNGMI